MSKRLNIFFVIISVCLVNISCYHKKQDIQNNETLENKNTIKLIKFTNINGILEVFEEHQDGQKEMLFSDTNIKKQYNIENKCFYIKEENSYLRIYYLEFQNNKILTKFISETSGYYFFSSEDQILVNIRSLRNPFGVSFYDINSGNEVIWLDMTQYIKNELYGDDIGKIQLDIVNNEAIITYYDLWNELFENLTVNLKSYDVKRQNIIYSKQIPIEVKNDLIIKPKINIIDTLYKIKDLGYYVTYGKEKDKQWRVYKKDDLLFSLDNVRLYIYDSNIQKVIFLRNKKDNGYYTLSDLDLNTLNLVDIGYSDESIILSNNNSYVAYKTKQDNNLVINILNLKDDRIIENIDYEKFIQQKYDSCEFVKFEYPILGILFIYNNTNDKYLELDINTNDFIIQDVNHFKDFKLDVPSIH
ncbi:hypothetical protein SAMN04487977_106108 [Treponema bryantii]|uniref:Uncharacterized protein n=1 Tax=Treponema bryantii TaxID=163 RepID=A0A1H9HA90_9SPIR|nr:hypothetical protein [Treponema bryantii]SEQ59186.1 hypothetical protein SAMN04487977_106108 [Treponema bryantii]